MPTCSRSLQGRLLMKDEDPAIPAPPVHGGGVNGECADLATLSVDAGLDCLLVSQQRRVLPKYDHAGIFHVRAQERVDIALLELRNHLALRKHAEAADDDEVIGTVPPVKFGIGMAV